MPKRLSYKKTCTIVDIQLIGISFIKDPAVALEIDFLKSEIIAKQLKEKKSQYTKVSVEVRVIRALIGVFDKSQSP